MKFEQLEKNFLILEELVVASYFKENLKIRNLPGIQKEILERKEKKPDSCSKIFIRRWSSESNWPSRRTASLVHQVTPGIFWIVDPDHVHSCLKFGGLWNGLTDERKSITGSELLTATCWLLVGLGLGLGVEFGVEISPDVGDTEPVVTGPTVGNARAGSACHCLWICCEVSRNLAPYGSNVSNRSNLT